MNTYADFHLVFATFPHIHYNELVAICRMVEFITLNRNPAVYYSHLDVNPNPNAPPEPAFEPAPFETTNTPQSYVDSESENSTLVTDADELPTAEVPPVHPIGSDNWANAGGIVLNATNRSHLKSLNVLHGGNYKTWLTQLRATNGTLESRAKLLVSWARDHNALLSPPIPDDAVAYAKTLIRDVSDKVRLGTERRNGTTDEDYAADFAKCTKLRGETLSKSVAEVDKLLVFGCLLPVRRTMDLAYLKIVDSRDDARDLGFNTFAKDDATLVFTKYKTAGRYGRQKYHLTGDTSAMLRSVCGDDAVDLAIAVLSSVPSGEMFIKVSVRSSTAHDARENNISKTMRHRFGLTSNSFRHWICSNIVTCELPVQQFVNDFLAHSPALAREYAVPV